MPTRDELIAYAMSKKGLDRATAEKKADEYLAKQGGGEKPAPKAPAPSAKPKATPSSKAAPSTPAPKVEPPKAGPAVKAEVPKAEDRAPVMRMPDETITGTPPRGAAVPYMPYVASASAAPADRYMATSPAPPPPEPEGSEVAAKYSARQMGMERLETAPTGPTKAAEMDGKRAALKRMRPDLAELVDDADDSEVSDLYAKHAATR